MPLPWSYSTLTQFETCPYSIKLKKIDKISDGSENNPIFKDGSDKHKLLEDYVIALKEGKDADFPDCASKLENEINKVIATYGIENVFPERKYAFDKDFAPVDFFDRDVWMRAVVDLMAIKDDQMTIVDYKSGRYNPYTSFKNQGQLQLYSVIGFMTEPDVEKVTTSIYYMKDGKIITKIYYRDKLPHHLQSFVDRGNNMFYADKFPARSSKQACKFCGYNLNETCEYRTAT